MFTMKSKVIGHLKWVVILFKVLIKKFVKDRLRISPFQKFRVNLHKFHALFSARLSQARLSQVLRKLGSENAHGYTWLRLYDTISSAVISRFLCRTRHKL
jgi:hypothetical protein